MPDQALAARLASAGAGMLSLSILADSGVEHYRGAFANPAMAVPIVTSALSLAISAAPPLPMVSGVVQATALASGAAGLGFHLFNIGKRVGGFGFTNLFYAAPIGAPAALILSGVLRNAADALAGGGTSGPFDWRSGRALGAVAALGIAGTVGEAALLHFRGAFQHPAMWLPVALPPLAAASLARDVVRAEPRAATIALLASTAVLGLAGAAFHARGVARQMGGWRNWRQNVLGGPPIPAPPAFTGLAIAGIGALLLMRAR